VQLLKDRKDAGDEICIARKDESAPLGSSESGFAVLRKENGVVQSPEYYDWDDDLNTAMIKLGIKACNFPQEGERFARVLRAALRKVERRYGDGYLNAVLVDLIDESDLGKDGEIGKVRRLIHFNSVDRSSRSYNECRDAIASEIGGRARELRNDLKYNPAELKTIMDHAIAQYLDERFSISSLRSLGWIDENGHTTR